MNFLQHIFRTVRDAFRTRKSLLAENLMLRHQLTVFQRTARKPPLMRWDRLLWARLFRRFQGWKSALILVEPETVLRWHRKGFSLWWRMKNRPGPGRPPLPDDLTAGPQKRLVFNSAFTHPMMRSRGLSKLSSEYLREYVSRRHADAQSILVMIIDGNVPSRRVHERYGEFQPIGVLTQINWLGVASQWYQANDVRPEAAPDLVGVASR